VGEQRELLNVLGLANQDCKPVVGKKQATDLISVFIPSYDDSQNQSVFGPCICSFPHSDIKVECLRNDTACILTTYVTPRRPFERVERRPRGKIAAH
jgi:hypothetical protein